MPISSLLALVVGAFAMPGAADAQGVTLLTQPFMETVHPATRISGSRFVGFSAARQGTPSAPTQFSAWIPQDWRGREICLRLMSADGLYESANDYRVDPAWPGGRAVLDYPTRVPDALRRRTPEEMAILVTSARCHQPYAEAALAFWGDAAPGPGMLHINTFRADQAFVVLRDDAAARTIACEPIPARVRAAFDARCVLDGAASRRDAAEVGIVSVKHGEMGPELALRLRFAPIE